MNYRLNTPAMTGVGIAVIIALGFFAYLFIVKNQSEEYVDEDTSLLEETEESDEHSNLTAAHHFEDGLHTIAGEYGLPSACHRLTHEVFFVDGKDERIEIQFRIIGPPADEVCAQVVTPARFKIEFEAPEDASIKASLNNESIRLNLIEVEEGEDLDSFEEFIKG